MSIPRALLLAHQRGEASVNQVLRGMMSHKGWLVPVNFFQPEEVRDTYKVAFGPRHQIPHAELWIYTEQGTATYAVQQGALLGAYVTMIPGTVLFQRMPEAAQTLKVNAGGYEEDLLELERVSFDRLALWARTVELEQALDGCADPTIDLQLMAKMRAHPEYHVPLLPDGRMIAKPGEGGFRQPGVVCSSPDSYDVFVAALDEELQQQIQHSIVDGDGLSAELVRQEIDAVYLNPFGPGPTLTWPRAVGEAIATAPRISTEEIK